MAILGLWAALVGYTVLYAGLANWQGSGISIPQAFIGSGTVKCGGQNTPANQLDPFAPGQPYTGPNAPGPTAGEPSGFNPQTGQFYNPSWGTLGNVGQ